MASQIVWFFSAPTVFVCPHCEVVAAYYTDKHCPTCGGPWVEFVASDMAIHDAEEERGAKGPPAQPRHPARLMRAFAAGWDARGASDYEDDSGFDAALAAAMKEGV